MSLVKTFSLLFFIFFFAATTNSYGNAEKAISIDEAKTFDVNAVLINFTPDQAEKIEAASELIRKIIISPEFKSRVLNYSYNGRRRFYQNGGLSNKQIYNKIIRGSEYMLNLGNNHTMDLELELYTDLESNTIGYTYPSIVRVFMNRKYFEKFKPYQVADNMVHEWLHKLGFKHDVEATDLRRHSVPYAVGYIVKAIARNYR